MLPGPRCAPPSVVRLLFVWPHPLSACTCSRSFPSVCACCCHSSISHAFGLCLFTLIPLHVPLVCAHSPLFAPADVVPAAVAIAHTLALVLTLGLCVPTLHAALLFVDLTCKSNISIFLIESCTYLGLGHACEADDAGNADSKYHSSGVSEVVSVARGNVFIDVVASFERVIRK